MSRNAPFWSLAELVSESANPEAFQVSLEDMLSDTGRLVEDKFSQYEAKGTPFLEGDVLFGKLRPYLAKYWLADRPGTAGGDIHVYRPAPDVEPRFLRYIIGNRDFIKYAEAASKGVKMPRVEWMGLREFGVYRPDLPVQQRIADYLDRETDEIDAMIAKMDELAGQLEERKSDVIQRATTARDTPMSRVKFFANVSLGKTVQGVQKYEHEMYVNYVRAASIQRHGLELDDQRMWMSVDELRKYDLRHNDVLVVEGGAGYGRSVVLEANMSGWGFQNHVIRLRPNRGVDGRFLDYCVKGHLRGGLIDILVDGATIPSLSSEKARELPVPSVTPTEQKRIADYLDEATSRIDSMLTKVAELKSLLTERRAALITDVVTGRKEVA